MTAAAPDYSNWDLTTYFPEFLGSEYSAFKKAIDGDVDAMLSRTGELPALAVDTTDVFARLIADLEQLTSRIGHISSYLGCLQADDATNEDVGREYASISALWSKYGKAYARLESAFKHASDEAFDALVAHADMEGAEFSLRRTRQAAMKTMDVELEELASDLLVNGFNAWGRLYNKVAGKLMFDMEQPDGSTERVPFALKRSLTENPDPFTRRAALEGSNKAWAEIEHVAAAALNAIAGQRLALYERRSIDHFLDQALFESNITRETLDAMLGAIADNYELPRRFLRRKAQLMGKDKLGFQDVAAPLPIKDDSPVTWSNAQARILSAFGNYPHLGEFTKMAFDKSWVESEVRAGKSPGGFCTSSRHINESRIFMTYNQTLGDVQTLAHELGHAFHNWVMRDLRPMARSYSMTLAETASTFAETLFTDSLLNDPTTSDIDRAKILDTRLEGSQAFLLNIPMRFLFEKRFYAERANGEVSVSRLKELMLEAQRETYGDVLDSEQLDPYFWATKLHFYITGVSFYNFPYSFGFLFSLGVYKRGQEVGEGFHEQYENLLRLTGSDTAENVAKRSLGVDLESKDFWQGSIDIVAEDLERFEAVTAKVFGN